MNVVLAAITALVLLPGCSHLSGGYVSDDDKGEGVRYYLPRAQFVMEQQVKGDKTETKIAVMRAPDLRFPHEVYMKQGPFSADIFDVELSEKGLIKGVSADASEQIIESVKSVASFTVDLASSLAGALPMARLDDSSETHVAMSPVLLAAQGNVSVIPIAAPCPVELPRLVVLILTLDTKRGEIEAVQQNHQKAWDQLRKVLASKVEGKEMEARQALVPPRVAAHKSLSNAHACAKTIQDHAVDIHNAVRQSLDKVPLSKDTALSLAKNQLALQLGSAKLEAAANALELDLLNSYQELAPTNVAAELLELSLSEQDEGKKTQLAEASRGIIKQLSIDKVTNKDGDHCKSPYVGLCLVQHKVRLAAPPLKDSKGKGCGAEPDEAEAESLKLVMGLMEVNIKCLSQQQQEISSRDLHEVVKDMEDVCSQPNQANQERIEWFFCAVKAVHEVIELILQPSEGGKITANRAADPLYGVIVEDKELKEERLFHRTLRARDRVDELKWTRIDHEKRQSYLEQQVASVQETMGNLAEIENVLEQRDVLRTFLKGPVQANQTRGRQDAQAELIKLNQRLEALRIPKSDTFEGVRKPVTPQVYWATSTSKIPAEGEQAGIPGDVFVILRPLVSLEKRGSQ